MKVATSAPVLAGAAGVVPGCTIGGNDARVPRTDFGLPRSVVPLLGGLRPPQRDEKQQNGDKKQQLKVRKARRIFRCTRASAELMVSTMLTACLP